MDDRLSVVRDVVSRSGALVVSTVGPQGPWCAPVGFSLEDGFRLAFLSLPETRHVQEPGQASASWLFKTRLP